MYYFGFSCTMYSFEQFLCQIDFNVQVSVSVCAVAPSSEGPHRVGSPVLLLCYTTDLSAAASGKIQREVHTCELLSAACQCEAFRLKSLSVPRDVASTSDKDKSSQNKESAKWNTLKVTNTPCRAVTLLKISVEKLETLKSHAVNVSFFSFFFFVVLFTSHRRRRSLIWFEQWFKCV